MKFRLGACAAVVLLAACSGQESGSEMAALRGSAGGDSLKSQARAVHAVRDVRRSIANAPDRGTLMSYQNERKPVKRDGAFTYYPVAMSEDHALKGIVTGHMTVPLPDGSEVKLKYERHEEGLDGNWTWVGRMEGGDQMQEAIITFGESAVFASIPQGRGKPPLSIRTQGSGLFAVEMDPSKVRSPNVGHSDMAIPGGSDIVAAVASQALAAKAQVAQNAVAMAAPPNSTNTIDVAVGYTPGFRSQAALKQESVSTALTFLFQVANQGFSNSKVNGYLRLVNMQEIAYTDTNANQTALYELTGSNGSSNVAVPAALVPLRTARDTYGADVALLIRGFQQPEHQGCGVAWLIGADGTAVDPAQHSRWGYGVVSYGDDKGTDGNSYYCAAESMVHEVGHLLGSAHDEGNSTSQGRYPYSYGYKSVAGNFYTIMAYGDEGQTPYRVFSNPAIDTCGNAACGIANRADNARSLNQTIPVVAQFRATVVPLGKAASDFDADGKSDILWRNLGTGANVIWKAANSQTQQAMTPVADLNWAIVGVGDFNGDGAADVLFRNMSTGANKIWRSGDYKTSSDITRVTDKAWQVVGVADFDGNGAADILWRNVSSGANAIWRSGSSTSKVTLTTVVGQNWRVAAVGDFNGDGKADIMWRSSTGQNTIWSAGDSKTRLPVDAVPGAAWQVAGVGDFDGDGNDDLLWRNSSTGANTIWRGANASSRITVSSLSDTRWNAVQVADFNGDGLDDILWRHSGTGSNTIWRSANSSTTQSVTGVTNQQWTVKP